MARTAEPPLFSVELCEAHEPVYVILELFCSMRVGVDVVPVVVPVLVLLEDVVPGVEPVDGVEEPLLVPLELVEELLAFAAALPFTAPMIAALGFSAAIFTPMSFPSVPAFA